MKKIGLAIVTTLLLVAFSIILVPETGYASVDEYREYEWNDYKSKTTYEKFGYSRHPATYSVCCNHVYTKWINGGVCIYGKDNSSFARAQWWCDVDWYPDTISVQLCYDYRAAKGYNVSGTLSVTPSASISFDYQYYSNYQKFDKNKEFEIYIRPDDYHGGIYSLDSQCLYVKGEFSKNNVFYPINSRNIY